MATDETEEDKEQLVFSLLRMLKGKELEDGGLIQGFTITFTDRKTGETRVVEV